MAPARSFDFKVGMSRDPKVDKKENKVY